jgi:hypothetical protein
VRSFFYHQTSRNELCSVATGAPLTSKGLRARARARARARLLTVASIKVCTSPVTRGSPYDVRCFCLATRGVGCCFGVTRTLVRRSSVTCVAFRVIPGDQGMDNSLASRSFQEAGSPLPATVTSLLVLCSKVSPPGLRTYLTTRYRTPQLSRAVASR